MWKSLSQLRDWTSTVSTDFNTWEFSLSEQQQHLNISPKISFDGLRHYLNLMQGILCKQNAHICFYWVSEIDIFLLQITCSALREIVGILKRWLMQTLKNSLIPKCKYCECDILSPFILIPFSTYTFLNVSG